MLRLTYEQSLLLELVSNAAREMRPYLIAPVEAADAEVYMEALAEDFHANWGYELKGPDGKPVP